MCKICKLEKDMREFDGKRIILDNEVITLRYPFITYNGFVKRKGFYYWKDIYNKREDIF